MHADLRIQQLLGMLLHSLVSFLLHLFIPFVQQQLLAVPRNGVGLKLVLKVLATGVVLRRAFQPRFVALAELKRKRPFRITKHCLSMLL